MRSKRNQHHNFTYQQLRCLSEIFPDCKYTPKHNSDSKSFALSFSENDWLLAGGRWEKELREDRSIQFHPLNHFVNLQFGSGGYEMTYKKLETNSKKSCDSNLLRMKLTHRTKVSCCATCHGADWSRCLRRRRTGQTSSKKKKTWIGMRNLFEIVPNLFAAVTFKAAPLKPTSRPEPWLLMFQQANTWRCAGD
jgi:hypothetical protein